jgi:POT family proton-dependent oligopeptide transporter
MAKPNYMTAPPATKKMPSGIPYILANEAGERFSFYGTRCILVIFMTTYLINRNGSLDVMTPEQSKAWFHLFVSAVYFTPIIGALLSDIWLGKYRTILYFSILYCVGFFTLAFDNTRLGLGIGLTLIAIGSGVIKPCISANVGDQFGQTNRHLIERVYGWFYFAINFGAFFAIFLTPIALDKWGSRIAFGIPAVLMVLATFAFWLGRKKFVHASPAGLGFIKETFSGEGLKAVGRLFIIYLFIAVFWSLWDQMDSAWVLQSEQMNRYIFGWEVLPAQISSVNALLTMVLIPVFSYVVYPAINRIFPLTALRKIGIGMFVIAFAFVISAFIQTRITAGEKPSIMWLLLAYVVLTSAEIMVSITGLEFSYTQAPVKMKSFIMSIFLLSNSIGDAFTALVNILIQNPDGTSKLAGANYFWFFASLMAATAVIFIFVARTYQPKTYIQDESSA